MEEFIIAANSTLKDLVEAVSKLSVGQENQNSKIDCLTLHVSELQAALKVHFQGHEVPSGICAAKTSNDRVVSPINEESEVVPEVSDESLQNDISNKEADEEVHIEPEEGSSQLINILENDDSNEVVDDNSQNFISTEEDTDNQSGALSCPTTEDSDSNEIPTNNSINTVGAEQEKADKISQNINIITLPKDFFDDDEMVGLTPSKELNNNKVQESPDRDIVLETESETDFECTPPDPPPVKTQESRPQPNQQLSPVKIPEIDLASESDDSDTNKNNTRSVSVDNASAQNKNSSIISIHDSDSSDDQVIKNKSTPHQVENIPKDKVQKKESDPEKENSGRKLKTKSQRGDSASRSKFLGSDSDDSESDSDENYRKFVDEARKKKDDIKIPRNKSAPLVKKVLNKECDPKLGLICKVVMTRIPEIIFNALLRGQKIIVDETGKGRKKDNTLTRTIKQLIKFQPILGDKKIKNRVPPQKNKISSRKKTKEVHLRSDGTDGSSDESRKPSQVKRYPVPFDDDLLDHRVDSDDELDALNSDSDENVARNKVLKSDKNLRLKSKGKDKKGKSSGKPYFTPKCVNLPSTCDSEASEHSVDDFNSVPLNFKEKKYISDSDSDDIESRSSKSSRPKRKREKDSSIEKVAVNNDDSIGKKSKHKHETKRLRPTDSNSDSDLRVKKKPKRKIGSESKEDKGRDKRLKVNSEKQKNGAADVDDDVQVVTEEPMIIEEPAVTEELTASQGAKRKNIRSIMSKKDLQKQTREAQDVEEKRKQRIAEKQKLFNGSQSPEDSVLFTDVVLKDLVLEFDKNTKEPIVFLDPEIVKILKPYQAEGINFLWESCFESIEQYKKPDNEARGCILAHCMGLGKTLQIIGFLHSIMTSDQLSIKLALVICPLNTVGNWAKELKLWLSKVNVKLSVHKLHGGKNIDCRVEDLETWHREGGVGIIHYDRFRQLVEGKKNNESYQPRIDKCLLDPGADIIICDEAHLIQNSESKVSVAINRIKTKRRILLTGTPLQNNLAEYHTMMQFVKPNLLGSIREFRNRFVNPITNGQHRDSNDHDVRVMKKRAHVLHKLLDGCVQRRDYSVLVPYLPPKHEYVLLIKMTDIQKKLYKHYLNNVMGEEGSVLDRVKQKKFKILTDFNMLSRIWSHPYSLSLKHTENNPTGHPKDPVDATGIPSLEESDYEIDWLDDDEQVIPKNKFQPQVTAKQEVNTNSTTDSTTNKEPTPSPTVIEQGGDWWSQFFSSKDDMMALEHSTKLIILFEILKTCESIGDKLLVFSQSLNSLNIIEKFLKDLDKEAERVCNEIPSTFGATSRDSRRWRINKEYYRIDGSTKTEDRQQSCDKFNKKNFNNAKLFLISTRAGGLGINLIGANRVVIFDASWNPAHDLQSIFRVFRLGQTKPCYIYRFLAQGTMEEKVYNRQVVKLSLSGRVIDEFQIERHFKFDDIVKMYDCDFEQKPDRPTPAVPKDRLLADLLISHKDILDNYLEHDSLLVNQADEGMTEEEKQIAWNEYHTGKDVRTKPNNTNVPPNNNNGQSKAEPHIKIMAKIRYLYPNLSEPEVEQYFMKVHKEMIELQEFTQDYHSRKAELSLTQVIHFRKIQEQKKAEVSKYLTLSGYLGQIMSKLIKPQGAQGSSASSTPNNGISITPINNISESDGIRVTPMDNNLESDGIPIRPMDNVEESSENATVVDSEPQIRIAPMSSILESPSKTPPSPSPSPTNFVPIRPMIRNPVHGNDQARAPQLIRSMPTTTIPYNPLNPLS